MHDYAAFLTNRIMQRKQDKRPLVENLSDLNVLVDDLTQTFHIQCRLLQLAVWRYKHNEIKREGVAEIVQILLVIIRNLIKSPTEKTDETLVKAHEWLSILDADYPSQIVFAHSTSCDLTIHDHLLWTTLERQQVSHLWWNWRQLISSPEQPAVEVALPPIQLTASQERGMELLGEIYSFHQQNKRVAGISTKPVPLLIGPSGCGKTALIRYFADRHQLPLLDLNPGNWIVSGAASHPHTLQLIRRFIRDHAKGLIYLDELDKFNGTTDWMRNVVQECMALLDQRISSFEGWGDEDRVRLGHFFIVGSGTWQNLYYEDSQVLGFDLADEVDLAEKLVNQKQIPDEILFRFPHVIEVKGLSAIEFKKRITQVREELNLPTLSKERLASLAHEAIQSRRQSRWLEQYVVRALREKTYPQ